MKKLLSVTPHLSTGGAPQVLVKRVELVKDDIDIYVVEYNNYSNDFVIQKNRLKKLLNPDHFFTLGDNKKEILDIIEKIQPDYVHFEEIPELFNIDFDIAKQIYKSDRKYKIFETTHSSDFDIDKKLFFPDKFLFVSQYNCFKFNKFGIPAEVIEYPVEKTPIDLAKKEAAMKKLGLDPKFKHVVNVGLFTPRKNQAYAFEIARNLKNENVKFHFIGNQADNFQDYWRPLLKIKPKNCILWNERDDVDDFLDACDLFLFTSMGFRWNKELNPLVIKEALEHQIPQFLFPLDVYNRKYDTEDTIHYLNGNVDIDAGLVKNFLFKRKAMPWIASERKYKIRAVHLLLEEDNRKSESIKELEKLPLHGIDYVQHINQRYTETPPREMCARPQDVGRIGAYSLRGPHYGNYQSFKKAIFTEFTDEVDFLIIFESDCKLTVPLEEFIDKIFKSCDHINERRIFYTSFGDNRNLRTGEMVSDNHGDITDWMYMTNKIIGIQSIMFPRFALDFIKRAYETTLWDVSDLLFNDMFKNKAKAIVPRLTTQIEGISTIQGENITHFLMKNISNLLKDKDSNDIIVDFNKEDQRFHFCLSDFYQGDIDDFSIIVNADINKNIYTVKTKLSPYNPVWVQIYGHQKYEEFSFDFYYKDEFLFTKKLKLNITPDSEKVREQIQDMVEEKTIRNIVAEEIPDKMDFNLDYKIEENRLYLPYTGNITDLELKVIIKNVETNDTIFTADKLIFNNNRYINWVSPAVNHYKTDMNFRGYSADYIKNDKVLFTREIILREKQKPRVVISNEPIVYTDKTKNAFVVLTYPNTIIKEDITEKCLESLKGNKIILASHYPVNKTLQDKADHYLYDSYNPLISHDHYNFFWSTIPEGKIELKLDKLQKNSNLNQSLTVLNNIDNSIRFARSIGYDKVICMSYDYIFNDDNLKTIQNLCDRIDNENKHGYFMSYEENGMKLYKSVFFIIKTDFYTKIFDTIRTPEEYNSECAKIGAHNFLENYFHNKLSVYYDKLIIENTNEDKLFNNQNINIFSGVEYLGIVPVKDQKDSFVIWFNSSNDKDNRKIEFIYDNNGNTFLNDTHNINGKNHYFRKLTLSSGDNYKITAQFIDSESNKVLDTQYFIINQDTYGNILNNGLFTEGNNTPTETINISFDESTNKISFWNNGDDFDGKFTVLDVDSKVPIHWCSYKIPKNTGCWILPIPISVMHFADDENFNGFDIQVYDKNDTLLFNKIIMVKDNPKKFDIPYLKWITPFDCLYFIWKDFFIKKIYDDFLSNKRLDVTIDLGANQGLFTHLLLTKGAKKVFAVEALNTCCDNMKKMFDNRVIIINKAISDTNGKKYLYIDKIDTTISNTDIDRNMKHTPNLINKYDKLEVDAITINDLIENYNLDKIDLLKVDIEGDEYLLFKSIKDENLMKIDNILIEYHHNYDNELDIILNRLKDKFNYELVHTNQANGGNLLVTKIKNMNE